MLWCVCVCGRVRLTYVCVKCVCVCVCVCAARLRPSELRTKSKADLQAQLKELKTELAALRVAKVTGGAPNKLSKIHLVRLGIAQINTVISQNQKKALREAYKDKVRHQKDNTRLPLLFLAADVCVCVCRCVPERGKTLTNRSCTRIFIHMRAYCVSRVSVHRVQTLLPLDLRPKKTRAIRRALTPAQKAMVTVKEAKRKQNFPQRKFAIKA